MNLHKITVEGFANIVKKQSFKFDNEYIYVVSGLNGSGKSSFFSEAISFLLFGTISKDCSIKNVVADGCECASVVGYLKDSKYETIERRRYVSGKTVCYIDGKEVSASYIDALVNCDRSLFYNSVIFAQGFGGFVYFSDKNKKDFITKLSIGFVDSIMDKLKSKHDDVGDKINIEQERKQRLIEQLQSERELRKVVEQELMNAEKKHRHSISQLKHELKENKDELQHCINVIDKLKKKRAVIEKELSDSQDKSQKIGRKVALLDDEIREIKKHIQNVEGEITAYRESYNNIKNKSECPLCLQEIKNAKLIRKKYERKIALLGKDVEEQKIALTDKLDEYERKSEAQERVFSSQRAQIRSIDEKTSKIALKIRDKRYIKRNIVRICDEIDDLKRQISKNAPDSLQNVVKRIAHIKRQIKSVGKLINELQMTFDGVEYWIERMRKFKNKIMNQIVKNIGVLSNEYLFELSNGRYGVQINSELKQTKKRAFDKFNIVITDNNKPIDFLRTSGGERRQIALAINMAFIQIMHTVLAGNWRFIVFDEIFDNLDYIVKERLFSMIKRLRERTGKCVIMITHDDVSKLIPEYGFKHIQFQNGRMEIKNGNE